jgi:hypothetical protein
LVCRGSVLSLYAYRGKQQERGRAFDGHLADHHQFLCRATDIDEQIEARLAPFIWKTIPDTRVLIAEDLGAAPTPLVLAQLEC